ncbi:SusC/RagA family TonB-linked outer membrane protein [uncultured Tenacibaculum sp.]|uniref:SusC/RagA family TonB-linked outer membrane protein n=1 Tax=uncultured Tenacibaculum sp. TaxID=174713 RepID=UPI002634E39A|nr:SusC/RagA family TonB-linked outer membrane protein [uncultured Tenacibaculum sp.]
MKFRFKNAMYLLLFLSVIFKVNAQDKTVSGVVSDDVGPLPGVNVIIKNTSRGTETDGDGRYSIKTKPGEVLVFSFVGMQTEERKVGVSNKIDVTLKSDQILEEIVVIGYGSAKKVGSVVGAISSVSSEVIQDKPSANVMDGLQGRVPGLQVLTSSGEPSATPTFRLHGTGSLSGGSTPLVVLDGVPVNSSTLTSLNSNDFESVTVLKDASATSIYGSRAANGVIYITSKKGRINTDPKVTIRTQYSISNLANTDFFENVLNSQQLADFQVETGFRTRASADQLLLDNPNDTKWYQVYYKENVGLTQNDISISGGGEKTTYYISASQTNQEGIAYQSDFERYTFRTNLDSKVKKWLRVGANLSLGYDERELNPSGSNSTNRGLAWLAQPWFSPVDENGVRYDRIPGWGRFHPAYREEKFSNVGERIQLNPSGYVQIEPFKNLKIKTQAGLDFFDFTQNNIRLPSFIGSLGNGSISRRTDRSTTLTVTNTAEYKFKINDSNSFTALVGHEILDNSFRSFQASSNGLTDDRLIELDLGPDNRDVDEFNSSFVFESYFGRLEYDYNNKYFFDFSVRQDGSSRFGSNNRNATFWSVGGLWKIKKENFLDNVNWLNDLSIRGSYGTSGNAGNTDVDLANIGQSIAINFETIATVGANQYNGSSGLAIDNPGNPDLGWEQQSKLSVGFSAELFNRVRLGVDYYNRKTRSMLLDVPVPLTTGFRDVRRNVGELTNQGVDVNLSFDLLSGEDFYFSPYININYNKEEVTELFNGNDFWIQPNTGVAWAVGQPVTYFYPIHAGVNPQTGLSEWFVPGSDISQTNTDRSNVTSDFNTAVLQQSTGIKRNAPINGGFGFSSAYKGFSLQADFAFSSGKYLINNDRFFSENPNVFSAFNQSTRVLDYWKQPGDVTTFPRYDGPNFTQFDSTLIEDASFIRLKNIILAYTIPSDLVKTVGLENVRLFTVGRNLLTFTDYLGVDPEVDSNIALGSNPNTKQISFGLEVKF